MSCLHPLPHTIPNPSNLIPQPHICLIMVTSMMTMGLLWLQWSLQLMPLTQNNSIRCTANPRPLISSLRKYCTTLRHPF